ncbi:MAG: peptidylprolyl isomerase [Flavobacteriales bacterium]|jgi:cyclophilin family peptidyl-prolyl cis-trans isomerase
MKKLTFFTLVLIAIVSCQDAPVVQNVYGDKKYVAIREAADQRNSQKLLEFMKSSDDSTRLEAAKGAISMTDSTLDDQLFNLLKDVNEQTRQFAAIAIGNNGNTTSVAKLIKRYPGETVSEVKREILIAIGKTFKGESTSSFETSSVAEFLRNIELSDEEIKIGYGVMLQHLHRKGLYGASLMRRSQFALQTSDAESREALAWAMATFKGMWLQTQSEYFSNWMKTERNSDVKLPLLIAYSNANENNESTLKSYAAALNANHQLNIVAIQQLIKQGATNASFFIPALDHPDDKVVIEALQALSNCNISKEQTNIEDAVSKRSAAVQAALHRLLHHHKINKDGKACFSAMAAAQSPYDKAHFIRALGNAPERCDDLISEFYKEKNPIILYALSEALCELYINDSWKGKTSFIEISKSAIAKHDSGVCDLFLTALESKMPKESEFLAFRYLLDTYLNKLKLPQEIEIANHIIRFNNRLSGANQKELKPPYNKKIDWEKVQYISKEQIAEFTTNKGTFKMKFYVEEAPGSVALITSLIEQKFYDGKYFHRVVPNFVAQGGCPIGNGMGGTENVIRSEFSNLRFKRGSVGLASSGKDTESCQFFITYSPKPHLDGRYTVFAEIIEGMDIVDQLQIGDQIISAELLKVTSN